MLTPTLMNSYLSQQKYAFCLLMTILRLQPLMKVLTLLIYLRVGSILGGVLVGTIFISLRQRTVMTTTETTNWRVMPILLVIGCWMIRLTQVRVETATT